MKRLIIFLVTILPHSIFAQVAGVTTEMSELLARCAPTVHPQTMAAIVSAESRGQQFAIADAGPRHLPWSQRKSMVRSYYFGTAHEASAKANELISSGHTVSLGPAQINDRNLPSLGLSVESVFEPCTNVGAGGRILTDFYKRALKEFGPGPRALRAAISAYNSGDWLRGDKDGYVDLVLRQVGKPLALKTGNSIGNTSMSAINTIDGSTVPSTGTWWKNIRPGKTKGREFVLAAKEYPSTE